MNAYCLPLDIKQRLTGDVPVMSGAFDGVIASIIPAVCAEIDREVAKGRAITTRWSFLADAANEVQWLEVAGIPTAGSFTLSLGAITTAAIAYNATNVGVASALNTALGAGTVTVAPAPAGGPWLVTFTAAGPQAQLVGITSVTNAASQPCPVVVMRVVGGVATPSNRLYRGADGGSRLLLIDDCVSVSSVSYTYSPSGSSQALVAGTDYLPWPYNGSPYTGLRLVNGNRWPQPPGLVTVGAAWGFATSVSPDVFDAAVVETIRELLAARAGEDDRIGITPFGSVVTSKAFTQKTWAVINAYGSGIGYMRRS